MAAIFITIKLTSVPATEEVDVSSMLTEVKTTQFFTEEEVVKDDMNKILSAGVNAPSAMNTQPWHFTAVTDDATTQKLADAMSSMKPPAGIKPPDGSGNAEGGPEGMPKPEGTPQGGKAFSSNKKAGIGDAPLTIVISCEEGAELSAGLAVQNMAVEAQVLGYGTKILTSPTMALNGENKEEYKELLKIPENQNIVAVLLVGKAQTSENNPDVISSATIRNPFDDVVTIIGE